MLEGRFVSSAEAARRLGLNASRIRALAERGELGARKLANRWLVDVAELELRAHGNWPRGRPMRSENAWAVLFLRSGEGVAWLEGPIKRRIEARSRASLRALLPRLRDRAKVRHFRGNELAARRLEGDPDFVRSGASASAAYDIDIKAPGVIDGYMPAKKVDQIAYRYALQPSDERRANVILRAVEGPWLLAGRSVAPVAAVAADLVGSMDPRSRRAGRQLLERLSA